MKVTGRDVHGGYAEYITVPVASAFHIPAFFSDIEAELSDAEGTESFPVRIEIVIFL